ncbi:MAG: C39 family peptidase [Desulfobacteraceae bacterium]|nr:C39 family peptidase [Desulfobacteraceae bacterium]
MHIIAVAAILVAFATGFLPQADIPEKQMNLCSLSDSMVRFREEIRPKEEFTFRHIVKQEHDYSCGSAALATYLNYGFGEKLSEKQVIRGMLKHGDKEQIKRLRAFSLLDMKRLCSVLGYDGAGYKAEVQDIKNSDYWPCIVPIKLFEYRHFVVLKGVHDNHVFLSDPFRGNISYALPEFVDAWFENVIFLISDDKTDDPQKNLLKLTTDDLCYITDDNIKDLIKDRRMPYEFPVYFERDDVKGEYQYYRP